LVVEHDLEGIFTDDLEPLEMIGQRLEVGDQDVGFELLKESY
jgi:hypothetical protein